MDFSKALDAHIGWRSRFSMAIRRREKFDVAIIEQDCRCDLGRWLQSSRGQPLGRLPTFEECVKTHAIFHIEAAKVARAVNAGDVPTVEALLSVGTTYSRASANCIKALRELEKEVARIP